MCNPFNVVVCVNFVCWVLRYDSATIDQALPRRIGRLTTLRNLHMYVCMYVCVYVRVCSLRVVPSRRYMWLKTHGLVRYLMEADSSMKHLFPTSFCCVQACQSVGRAPNQSSYTWNRARQVQKLGDTRSSRQCHGYARTLAQTSSSSCWLD